MKSKYNTFSIFVLSLTVCLPIANIANSEIDHQKKRRQVSAHEHGAGKLNLVVQTDEVHAEIILPGYDVKGFGHDAHTAEEKKQESDAAEFLKDAAGQFEFTAAAQCSSKSVRIKSLKEEHEEEHSDHHDEHKGHDDESEHSDFQALYHFNCISPKELSKISVNTFKHFKTLKNIDANLVINGKQQKISLTKEHNSISIVK